MYINRQIQIGIELLTFLADRRRQGATRREIAATLGVSPDRLGLVLWQLSAAGLICRSKDNLSAYCLALAPDLITLVEAFDALDEDRPLRRGAKTPTLKALSRTAGPDLVWAGLEASVQLFLETMTLADLSFGGVRFESSSRDVFKRIGGLPAWRPAEC